MSTLKDSVLIPNSIPRRASEIALADQIIFFLGRHATLGHAPPTRPRSTTAVLRRVSRVHAANLPAIPLPMIRSSNFSRLAMGMSPFQVRAVGEASDAFRCLKFPDRLSVSPITIHAGSRILKIG